MNRKVVFLVLSTLMISVPCQEEPATAFLVPNVPSSVANEKFELEASNFVDIWKNRILRYIKKAGNVVRENESQLPVPRTLVAVTPVKMSNLIPQDAHHPLYSEEFESLTDSFILDSLSADPFDFQGLNSMTDEGIKLKSLSGKDLVIQKSSGTEKLKLNGIKVETIHHTFGNEDPVTVFVLADFLFNHYQEVKDAFKILRSKATSN